MLPIYMIPRQEFGLRKKHLRPIHLFSDFVLMPDTAKPLSRMFPVNWGLASIFRRVSSLYGRSCPSGGSESVLWCGSTTPAAFPRIMKYLFVFLLSPGNDNDSTHAIELMRMTGIAGSNLLGDKAYGTKEILTYIKEHGAAAVIPPKSNAKEPWEVDYFLYKEWHLVECFFQKLKWFRRVATRYDKLDKP